MKLFKKISKYNVLVSFLSGIGLLIISIVLSNISTPITLWISGGTSLVKSGPATWRTSLGGLSAGQYVVSVGRPRGPCDIILDGVVIESTRSSKSGFRSKLPLRGDFAVSDVSKPKLLEVDCRDDAGLSISLPNDPILAPYNYGAFLQLFREFMELYIGPTSSLLLISIFLSGKKTSTHQSLKIGSQFIIFGIGMLLYTLSNSQFFYLFFSGIDASIIHTCIRVFVAWTFYSVCAYYAVTRKWVHVVFALLFISFPLFGLTNPSYFRSWYRNTFWVFLLMLVLSIVDLREIKTKSAYYLRMIAVNWGIVLCVNSYYEQHGVTPYPSAAIPILISLLMAHIKIVSDDRSREIETTVGDVLGEINGKNDVQTKLIFIGIELYKKLKFARMSIYIDEFAIGKNDIMGKRFHRLAERGYTKDTKLDNIIDLSEGRGSIMQQAVLERSPLIHKSRDDGSWIINVPIGRQAVINLSNANENHTYQAFEALDTIKRIFKALQGLDNQIDDFASRMAFELESLRLSKGDGNFPVEVGSIFVDLNSYSDNMEKFGKPYADFIAEVYMPALCKRVRPWAVREGKTSGDGVYLVCIQELMHSHCRIPDAVYHVLVNIMKFAKEEGSEFCTRQGFKPIRVQVGANFGEINLVCGSLGVTTNGNVVVEAARLQSAAPPGGTLVHRNLAAEWKSDGELVLLPEELELVKTKRLKARRVYLKESLAQPTR